MSIGLMRRQGMRWSGRGRGCFRRWAWLLVYSRFWQTSRRCRESCRRSPCKRNLLLVTLQSSILKLFEDPLSNERLGFFPPHQVHRVALQVHRTILCEQFPVILQTPHLNLVMNWRREIQRQVEINLAHVLVQNLGVLCEKSSLAVAQIRRNVGGKTRPDFPAKLLHPVHPFVQVHQQRSLISQNGLFRRERRIPHRQSFKVYKRQMDARFFKKKRCLDESIDRRVTSYLIMH